MSFRQSDPNKKVAEMFGRITPYYDFLNHVLSLGLDTYWRKQLVRSVQLPGRGTLLDLAAGTLDVSRVISRAYPKARIIGLDVSGPMLRHGRRKRDTGNILPVRADARYIPLARASVDCATIAFGIRNVYPRKAAYSQILDVLSPGGKLCILEFGSCQGRVLGGIYNRYLHSLLPKLGKLLSRDEAYTYLARTISNFPQAEHLAQELHEAGFENVGYTPLSRGIVWIHTAYKKRQ